VAYGSSETRGGSQLGYQLLASRQWLGGVLLPLAILCTALNAAFGWV
jgi:hypothetical protein